MVKLHRVDQRLIFCVPCIITILAPFLLCSILCQRLSINYKMLKIFLKLFQKYFRMSRTLTDFHLGNSNSNMQTLDKRISASTDQLDSIRGESEIFSASERFFV